MIYTGMPETGDKDSRKPDFTLINNLYSCHCCQGAIEEKASP